MSFDLVLNLLGGVGLLLLGMKLMTDGLKLAGGPALRRILKSGAKTPFRGLMFGFILTALVQSSGAVTVAAIGFVNAGIMSLGKAVWVVYGSNIGTTATAWIVAMLGLKIKIQILALPLIAVGVAMWISGRVNRMAASGEAVAGFGVFFIGIEVLKNSLEGVGTGFPLHSIAPPGLIGQLVFIGIGFGLTLVMQSSSAALALVLTTASQGLLPLDTSAAAVIGANLGSTSTAALAVIGATPNAKRLAAVHVVFNALTGIAAVIMLGPILRVIIAVRNGLDLYPDAASILALFHTMFNVLGVLILWPLTDRLVRAVKKRFRTFEEDEGRPRYLDDMVVHTPPLALNALIMEVGRIAGVARRMILASLACRSKPCPGLAVDKAILERLQRAAGKFSVKLSKEGLSDRSARVLPRILRVTQYFKAAAETALEEDSLRSGLESIEDLELAGMTDQLLEKLAVCVETADPESPEFTLTELKEVKDDFEEYYQAVKQKLLDVGSSGRIYMEQMTGHLDFLSKVRRLADQTVKGARLLYRLRRSASISMKGDGGEAAGNGDGE